MKKLFSVLAVLFVLGTAEVFAFGIGPQGGYTVSGSGDGSGNGALTFKLDSVPCVFAVSAEFGDVTAIGLTADWWIANPVIQGPWRYFYGVGLAGSFTVGKNSGAMFFGGRALIGTDVYLLNNFLELYLQLAWQPGIAVFKNQTKAVFNEFPVNFGLRFWF